METQHPKMAGPAALDAQFALTKFRPPRLPPTLVSRPALQERLSQGAGKRLSVVVGSAGAGKTVLLAEWAAARPPGVTSWLSCDRADEDQLRFWAGFIEAPRAINPEFGGDATELLAMDGVMSADVAASIADDARHLPAGSAIIVDDFHFASAAAAKHMNDLVGYWPAETVQLVLSSRFDPPLRLHRLRMSGELCELRDPDLSLSLTESHDLLANFGVEVAAADLRLLHERSEGWAAALQMVALSLRGASDPARVARALAVHRHAIAEYFISEVLDQQPPEVIRFMLDTSVLGELTAGACTAVTRRQDAPALLRRLDAANLFLVALDEERTTFRYHRLVRHVLRAELRAGDSGQEQVLHQRAAEWYEAAGNIRLASRHFLGARKVDRALALLQHGVVGDFLRYPGVPAPLDPSMITPTSIAESPHQLLAVAADLLLHGDAVRGGEYLDIFEQTRTPSPPEPELAAKFAALRSFYYGLTGQVNQAVNMALKARAGLDGLPDNEEWNVVVQSVLLRLYAATEDVAGVEREAALARASPAASDAVKRVLVPGSLALAWFEAGRLADAAKVAESAAADTAALGFANHFFAVDQLRALAGLALERRDLEMAEQFTERVLSITEHRRPIFEFLGLLDRAGIWAARGQVREALATVEAARGLLPGARTLLVRADEQEALLRLSLGDVRSAAELAIRMQGSRRSLLLARIALARNDPLAAHEHLQLPSVSRLSPRQALVRQLLLTATAIERNDPMTASVLLEALQTARRGGFLNTVVTVAPQSTSYLIEHSTQLRQDLFNKRLIAAALEAHATRPSASRRRGLPADALTPAELRILKLLPTSTYLQMAAALGVSRNTVKTHLRSIYQKLCVVSRSEAIQRAIELGLL